MQDNPDIANLSHQVILENTPQGLRIQLVDQDGRPMFQQGSNQPMPYARKLLASDRIYEVAGKAGSEPLQPEDPNASANRRLSILLVRESLPVPTNTGLN